MWIIINPRGSSWRKLGCGATSLITAIQAPQNGLGLQASQGLEKVAKYMPASILGLINMHRKLVDGCRSSRWWYGRDASRLPRPSLLFFGPAPMLSLGFWSHRKFCIKDLNKKRKGRAKPKPTKQHVDKTGTSDLTKTGTLSCILLTTFPGS